MMKWMLAGTIGVLFAATTAYKNAQDSQRRQLPFADSCANTAPFIKALKSLCSTSSFQQALAQLKSKTAVDNSHEHLIAFGSDSSGNLILSDLVTGNKSNTTVPYVVNSFADLHNHPKNTPPSSGDLYGLLRLNNTNKKFHHRFVLTRDEVLYAFVITDTALARQFEKIYPSQQVKGFSPLFPDPLLDEYREMMHLYKVPEQLAMAWMLETYHAGVNLFQADDTGTFKKLRTTLTFANGKKVFTASYCW